MKMKRRLFIKLGTMLLASTFLFSSVSASSVTDKIVVSNTQYDEYNDLVSLRNEFNTMLGSKEYMTSGKYPYELYGPIVAYTIVLNKMQAKNPEMSTRYQEYLNDMVSTANTITTDNDSPKLDTISNQTIIDSAVTNLLAQYEIIKTNFSTLTVSGNNNVDATDLYNYVTSNSNHIYNVLNTFVMIRKYESMYEDNSDNYCITVESINSVNKTLEALYEMYSNINQEFGVDSLASKVSFNKESKIKDLVWDDKTNNLSPLYLYGLSLTATYIPFVTDLSRQDSYQYLFENVTGDSTKTLLDFLQYRKPLYANISKTSATDYLNGQTFSGKPITLSQFLEVFKSTDKEIVLCLRKDSLSDKTLTIETTVNSVQSSSGATPSPTNTNEEDLQEDNPIEENSDEIQGGIASTLNTTENEVIDKDKYGYTEPVYIAGLMKDGDVNSKKVFTTEEVDYMIRDKHYVRVSNFNFGIMYNIVNATNTGQRITDDLNKPLSMDILGNIVTASGIVILPAIANTTLYDYCISNYKGAFDTANTYSNYFFPENATFKLAYPYIDEYNGSITTVQDSFVNKFTFATNANSLINTSDISNLNYYLKFMSSSDLKMRRKGYLSLLKGKTLTTTHDIQYPTFPMYPYQIGKDSKDDNGTRKQIINKGSFSSIHSKNGLLAQRSKENQHYVLNVGHILVSDQSGNYYNTANIGFSDSVTQGIYDLTKYYLIMNKSTGEYDASNPKHNNTFKANLMKEIAYQVNEGSKDVNEMVVGESLSNLNFQEGDNGMSTSTISGWCEGLHFSISKNSYLGSILYSPKLDELPLVDRLAVVVKPVLILLAVFGIFALILSWKPFGIIKTVPRLGFKVLIYFTIVASVFKLMPSFVTYAINKPVNALYRDLTLVNAMTDLEVKEKNIKTSYFKGYSELDTTQSTSRIMLAELSLSQYKQIYETIYGSSGFISEFGFLNYFNSVTKIDLYDSIYLQGNKIYMTLDDVFSSSTIKAYEIANGDNVNTSQYIVPELKQSWYKTTELHYFTPYHLITENLLHVLNTVTTNTNGNVFPLDYSSGTYKVTGFLRNYMKSNYYLKTSSERMQIINDLATQIEEAKQTVQNGGSEDMTLDDAINAVKYNQEIIGVITGIDSELRTNQDFLGITKWSGLHTSAEGEKPFGSSVIDDIKAENQLLGASSNDNEEVKSLENTKSSLWYSNEYFNKARWQLERVDDTSKLEDGEVNLIINGITVDQSIPIKMVEDRLYVLPQSLTIGIDGTNYAERADGSGVIYTPNTVVDIVKDESSSGTVKLYSNGAYLGNVASIESDGKTLVALTNTRGSLESTNGGSLGSALDVDVYYNSEYNTVMVFYPEMDYYGDLGTCYNKILKVNDATRSFMNSLYDISLNISDENLIKAIALNATLEFNKQFSTSDYKLYPQTIEMNSLNFDVLLKQLFISDVELARSSYTHSLYNYIALTDGVWTVIFTTLFEVLLVILIIMRDAILSLHTVLLPLLSIIFYIFSNKWFYKPWLGTLISFIGVAVVNILTMLGFLAVNSMTSSGSSGVTWSVLLAIVITVVGIIGYGYLWYFLFKDIRNLGYVKAKGMFGNRLNNLKGKLLLGKNKRDDIDKEVNPEEVVSTRIDDMTGTRGSNLGIIERYQTDIRNSDALSSRININSETTSASSLSESLSKQEESLDNTLLGDRYEQINSTSYSDLSQKGSVVSRNMLNTLNATSNLKHGKDYHLIGDYAFVTNDEVIKANNLTQSHSVIAPYSKSLVKDLEKTGTPYSVEKDMIRYVSATPNGIKNTTTTYEDGVLTVPNNAVKTVKDYLKSQDVDFKNRGETFSILDKDAFNERVQKEVSKIAQPLKVTTKHAEDSNGVVVESNTSVVSPDSMLSEMKAISSRITNMRSNHSKRSVSTINSNRVNKLFKPNQEVYTYSLHLDKDTQLKPLINDLHQIANKIESNTARNKALTLRTTDGISVVFESQDDYNNFKHRFTEATADYFVRPTIYKDGNNVSVYTLKGDSLETKRMTLEEFNASDLRSVDCRKLN